MKPTNTPVTPASVEIDMEHEAHAERAWHEMQRLRARLGLRLFQPVEQATRPKRMSKKQFENLIGKCRKLNGLYIGAISLASNAVQPRSPAGR